MGRFTEDIMSNVTSAVAAALLVILTTATLVAVDVRLRKEMKEATRVEAAADARARAVQAQHRMLECVRMPLHSDAREWCILFRTPN